MSFKLLILLRLITMALDFAVTAAELELLDTGSLNNHSLNDFSDTLLKTYRVLQYLDLLSTQN